MAAARAPQAPQAGGLLICTPAQAAVIPLKPSCKGYFLVNCLHLLDNWEHLVVSENGLGLLLSHSFPILIPLPARRSTNDPPRLKCRASQCEPSLALQTKKKKNYD